MAIFLLMLVFASLLPADTLMTQDGSLHATQRSEAVLDPQTDQWSIQLQCGVFPFRGQPPIQVEWITPSGQSLTSSDYSDGHFNLLLKSPLQGGSYTCRVHPQHADDVRLYGNDAHQGEATVYVDKVEARLSLLEAELTQTMTELNQTKAELTQTRTAMTAELTGVSTRLQSLKNRTHQQIGFHARRLLFSTPPQDSPLIVNTVMYNVGNAYDNTTGYFTAPFPGLYFFTATITTSYKSTYTGSWLMVDKTQLSLAIVHAASGYHNSATVHGVMHLTAGQRVWLYSYGDMYFSSGTTFSGGLLSPDP